jgi:hypothetical protein
VGLNKRKHQHIFFSQFVLLFYTMTDNNQIATTEEVVEDFKAVCIQLIPFLEGHIPDYDLVKDYISNRVMVRNHHTGKLTNAYVTKVQAQRDVKSQK